MSRPAYTSGLRSIETTRRIAPSAQSIALLDLQGCTDRGLLSLVGGCVVSLSYQLWLRLGEAVAQVNGLRCSIHWPGSGGFLEAIQGPDHIHLSWMLVDPWGAELPLIGEGLDLEGRLSLRQGLAEWDARVVGSPDTPLSERDYLALLERSPVKLEWVGGRIVAMAVATPEHNDIASNLLFLIRGGLRGRPCRATLSDLKVRSPLTPSYRLPDLVVTCGERRFAPEDPNAVVNPTLLGEILSEGTRNTDHTDKVAEYQSIPSLQHYLIVETSRRFVTLWSRTAAGWSKTEHPNGGAVSILDPSIRLSLDEIYEGTRVPETASEG